MKMWRDLKIKMKQSGGLFLAGQGPSDTFIFISVEMKMQTNPSCSSCTI